jgi:transcriptional regulator of met regulon
MSHSSKTKSPQSANTIAVNNLPEHFTTLVGTLKTLMVTLEQVREEITVLQPLLLELTKTVPETQPTAKKSSSGTPKKTPVENKTNASVEKETTTATVEKSTTATASQKYSPTFLKAINTLPIPELADKLKSANTNQNVIKNIVRERKKVDFKEFTSLEDIILRIKGLAKTSLDKILNQWS